MMTAGFVLVVVLVGLLTAVAGSAAAQSAEFVDLDASDLEGSGTADNPYVITNASELQAMENDLNANYILGNDIDASATAQWNNGAGFDPVGDGSGDFTGNFDGQQFSISQLTINRGSSGEEVGLFGEVDSALIESVHLDSVTISGNRSVGALAGYLEEDVTIQYSSMNGSVSGSLNTGGLVGASEDSSVTYSSADGTITGSNDIGGLVGQSVSGIVTQSSSNATVEATGEEQGGDFARAGGLVGGNYDNSVINKSYTTGDVTGGKAGGITGENYNGSSVNNTYAAGNVDGRTESLTGGVTGDNIGSCPFQNQQQCEDFEGSTVANSYWDTETTGQDSSDGNATGLSTSKMTGSAAETNMVGFAFGTIWQTQPNDYPVLVSSSGDNSNGNDDNGDDGTKSTEFVDVNTSDLEGSGTAADPYVITNASELQAIEDNPYVHYKLGNDIDASATSKWNGGSGFAIIETFGGHFDGNQHEISGLSIDRKSNDSVGLFGEIYDATVENVHISNSSIRGRDDVGILAGSNSAGSVIRNVFTDGTVIGANTVGGLIGYNIDSSVVTQSSSSADIIVSPTGRDTPNDAGGLVGANLRGGIINQSYATGDVDGVDRTGGLLAQNYDNSHVAYTYAKGSVNGSEAGGLVAGNYAGSTVTNSYWNTKTSGLSTSDGAATGLTTSQMVGQAAAQNMSKLDFGTIWQTKSNSYPILAGSRISKPEQQVELSNIQFEPSTVDSSQTHTLNFTVSEVSADGNSDTIEISMPNNVAIMSVSDAESTDTNYDVTVVNSGDPIELVVNPNSPAETVTMDIEVNIKLSANN